MSRHVGMARLNACQGDSGVHPCPRSGGQSVVRLRNADASEVSVCRISRGRSRTALTCVPLQGAGGKVFRSGILGYGTSSGVVGTPTCTADRSEWGAVCAFGKDHVTRAGNFDTGEQDAAEVVHQLAPSGSTSLFLDTLAGFTARPGFGVGPRIGWVPACQGELRPTALSKSVHAGRDSD